MTSALLLLCACAEDRLADEVPGLATSTGAEDEADVEIRVDVLPSAVRDGDAALRVLPMSTVHDLSPAQDLALGVLALPRPERQPGSVVAWQLSPSIASLPGSPVAVAGTVFVERPGTLQRYAARTAEDGTFEAWVVPDQDYRLNVVPDDPMIPAYAGDLPVGARPVEESLDLGVGVPIYGRITSRTGPISGGRVHVESVDGHASATAVADHLGVYQIRVEPGTWTIVSDGRALDQDPTLRVEQVEVGEDGAEVDFDYPTSLDQVLVEGRITDPTGEAVPASTVRLRATSLQGYDGVDGVSWTTEAPVSATGTFLAKVVPGRYLLEALPLGTDAAAAHAPVSLDVDLTGADNDVGEIALPDLAAVTLRVRDDLGDPLADAQVTCVETGFDGDTFTAFTDENGAARTSLPGVELACDVTPPGERPHLATRHDVFVPEDGASRPLDLVRGRDVSGTVEVDGQPEGQAVVEIRGPDDRLLGFDVTDDDGGFEIPVDTR